MLNNIFYKNLLFTSFVIVILIIPVLVFADADRIFKDNSKAVVVVVTLNEKGEPISQGSGFIVSPDGAVVTNYHVISNAKDIKVKVGDNVLDVEGFIHSDKGNDLVILKAKGENLPTVKLGDLEKAHIGEKIYVISSPEGLENTISDGILSGIRDITPDKKILQITAPISPGSSGGPVFNNNGEVIGVATFLIKGAQNLNFAMPVNLIKDKIESKKVTAFKGTKIDDYKNTAEYWVTIGYHYFESGLYKEAIDANKQAIRIKPDSAWAHFGLGIAYGKLKMYKEEIEAYKQFLKIEPDDEQAYFNLGIAYRELGMYREAIDANKQAIRIKPDYAEAHYNLGVTYGESGMYKEEIKEYKEAIRIKPDLIEAHNDLGFTYGKLEMYKEAVEEFKQVIRIKPNYANAHYGLGLSYIAFSDRSSALEEYKILKDLDRELANELFNLIYK
jgi:tetratricopeptide (TPR) repeat protein